MDDKSKQGPARTFPMRLHKILSMPEYEAYITWLPHGRAWRIINKVFFEKKVIPHHFRHARYASFMRQVNGWGFNRVTEGPDHNSYYHQNFLRDYPELCREMQRPTDCIKSLGKKEKRGKETVIEIEELSDKKVENEIVLKVMSAQDY